MSTSNLQEENPATAQVMVLFGIIIALGLFIFTLSPSGSREFVADHQADVISNPQIDESNITTNSQNAMPVAMFNLVNPNGWDTPETITLVGTFQSELGCTADNTHTCPQTQMHYDILGDIWRTTLKIPQGTHTYYASLDGGNHIYGQHGISGKSSPPIEISLSSPQFVNFYYDHKTGWITDDTNSLILTMPSNFQDEVGCLEEWNAGCFRTWMQDVDGDGIYTYETLLVPGGSWEARIAVNGDIDTSYGQGGTYDGANFPLWIPNIGHLSIFSWDDNLKTFTPYISQMPLRLSDDLPEVAPNQE